MIESSHLIDYLKTNRQQFDEDFSIRIHRSLSWLKRSEQEEGDQDARYIFLWISFNAIYAGLGTLDENMYQKKVFNKYFEILIEQDKEKYIYEYIWSKFTSVIRSVLTNEFLLPSYWKHHDNDQKLWIEDYEQSKRVVNFALSNKDSVTILNILFDRLYLLRNQIFHGSSTWNSKVNREQLDRCIALLGEIVPIFLTIMMHNPNVDWGELAVPVLNV